MKPSIFSLAELIESGLLQEVNLTFFHPLGLALTVMRGDGVEDSLHISDYHDRVEFDEVDLKKREVFEEWRADRILGWEWE